MVQPGRVVGQRAVLVAEFPCGEHHLLDRRRAVGPVRVHMQIALQRGADVTAAEILGVARNSTSASGSRPAHACAMTFAVFGPMPGNDCQLFAAPWRSRSASDERFDDVGGVAVGHHPPRVFACPVLVVGDLTQGDDRIHVSSVPGQGARQAGSRPLDAMTRSSPGAASATGTAGPNKPSTGRRPNCARCGKPRHGGGVDVVGPADGTERHPSRESRPR